MCRLQKTISAVLVAAGSSTRMGFDKLSFDLGGETVLHRSIRAFDQCPQIGEIVLVAGKNRAFVEHDVFTKVIIELLFTGNIPQSVLLGTK